MYDLHEKLKPIAFAITTAKFDEIEVKHQKLPTGSFVCTRSVIIVLTSIGELISPNRSVSLLWTCSDICNRKFRSESVS